MSITKQDCEVFEVRLYVDIETGDIYDVEPIDEDKYSSDEIKIEDLPKSAIRGAQVMLFSHNSPGCLKWKIVRTANTYRRICVKYG